MLLWFVALGALAQTTDPQRIQEAAARLDSGPPAAHEAAWETLVAAGPAGVPQLSRLRDGAGGRLRDYLDLALFEIRFREQLPGLAAPRRVTYSCKDKPLPAILGDLEVLLKCQIAGPQDADDSHTASLSVKEAEPTELLQALAQACASGIRLEDGIVFLDPERPCPGVVGGWGAWRVRLAGFDWSRKWDFRGPREDFLNLGFEVFGVPSDSVVRFQRLVLLEARDSRGRDLLIRAPEAAAARTEGGTWPEAEQHRVNPPTPATRTLRCLRGYLPVEVSRRSTTATLKNLVTGGTITENGITLIVSSFAPAKSNFQVNVFMPVAWGPSRYLRPVRARLQFAHGTRMQVHVASEIEDDRLILDISWDSLLNGRTPPPESLAISIETEVVQRRIPFEFREVELK